MPSIKLSSAFLFCLSYKASPRKQRLWDCPETLSLYGLAHPPSRREEVPVLPGLTRASMTELAEFIDAIEKVELKDRPAFIDYRKKDDAWFSHRSIWVRWYRSFASKVNNMIDTTLRDNDCLPHQRMRAMEMEKFPPAETCAWCPNELAKALFGEAILSGDQVGPEIEAMMKTIVTQALASRWSRKYQIAMNVLVGAPLPSWKQPKKARKAAPNHLALLEVLAKSESFHKPTQSSRSLIVNALIIRI